MRINLKIYFMLSLAITLVGSVLAYLILGQPALIGMDDANITHVYARNLSAGYGYVYTPGFERVEGSTSPLWTFINVAAFVLSSKPELILLGISFLLTAGAVFFVFCIFEILFDRIGASRRAVLALMSIVLIGMFGFYTWNVLSLMDLALWTFLLNGFILVTVLRVDARLSRRNVMVAVAILSVLLGLARPEAMVLVPILLAIGAIGEWRRASWPSETIRIYGAGLMCSLLTTGFLALFRTLYFGVPFPNTYYAKVSNNPIDNLKLGLTYLAKFSAQGPMADVLILGVAVCFVISAWKLFLTRAGATSANPFRCLFVLSGAVIVVLALTFATGGDHFGSFRLYQPVYPLLFVIVLIAGAAALRKDIGSIDLPRGLKVFLAITVSAVFLLSTMAGFHLNRGVSHEFDLAKNGRALGAALNRIAARSPGTRVAVTAAGGVAVTYKGRILDLMGLNWPKMAHATERRSGVHGHSAFVARVFWAERPELVMPAINETLPHAMRVTEFRVNILNGLPRSDRFLKEYTPVAIPVSEIYVVAYARRDWIADYTKHGKIFRLGNSVN